MQKENLIENISNIPGALIVYEVESADVLLTRAFSDEFCEMAGCTIEEAREIYPDAYSTVAKNGHAALREHLEGHLYHGNIQCELLRADGNTFWSNCKYQTFEDDGKLYMYTMYTDITELKQREAELVAQAEELRALAEAERAKSKQIDDDERLLRDAMKHADMLYFAYYPERHRYENLIVPESLNKVSQGMDDYPESVIRACRLSEEDAEKYRAMVRRIDKGEAEAECVVSMLYQGKFQWMRVKLFNFGTDENGETRAVGFATNVNEYIAASQRLASEIKMTETLRKDILGTVYVNVTKDTVGEAEAGTETGVKYNQEVPQWLYEEALSVDPRIRMQEEPTRNLLLSAAEDIIDEATRREYIAKLNHFGLLAEYEAGHYDFTLEYRRKLGDDIRWVSTQTVFVEDPETRDILAFFYLRDINEQKVHERITNLTFLNNYDCIALIRPGKSTITYKSVSPKYMGSLRQHGLDLNKPIDYVTMLDSSIGQRIEPKEFAEVKKNISIPHIVQMLAKDDTYLTTYDIKDPDGMKRKQLTYCWLDDLKREILVTRIDATLTYEREQRQLAQLSDALNAAEAANKAKSEFLSRMSHDIRTPINAILGFSTLLLRDAENPEKVVDESKKILSSSRHLLGLINDVLDMSKIESGKIQLNVSEFSLAETVSLIDGIMRPQMEQKNQTFDIYVTGLRHDKFIADDNRIQQILINILSNATKYTEEGGRITMSVNGMPQTSGKFENILFEIADNGRGMTEEYQKVIFEPFSREWRGQNAKVQGTGLGMAITRNLVEMMGGTISVKSKENVGSTFSVMIPMRTPDRDEDIHFWEQHNVSKMLVVDDNKEVCGNVRDAMKESGVELDCANDGNTAVYKLGKAHDEGRDFDVVLLDWIMPGMDGLATTREIRKTLPPDVLIIILTAYDYSAIEEEAKAAGVDGFMLKPFFVSNLQKAIDEIKSAALATAATDAAGLATGAAGAGTDGRTGSPQGASNGASGNPLAGLNLLAAEDNELNAEILYEILLMNDARVTVEPDGKLVAERFRREPAGKFDMILMDVQMPVMDGYEATRAIRAMADDESLEPAKRREAANIPIIAMTANAFSEDVQNALVAGMNAHVAKPLNIELMKKTIAKLRRLK